MDVVRLLLLCASAVQAWSGAVGTPRSRGDKRLETPVSTSVDLAIESPMLVVRTEGLDVRMCWLCYGLCCSLPPISLEPPRAGVTPDRLPMI
jgi:hypothetical protein